MSTDKSRINAVYEIFKDYYGDDKVDLQETTIYVWWPSVRITNEYEDTVDISDLYAKVKLTEEGTMETGFYLNRGSYTKSQLVSNYMHSHISSIPFNDPTEFQTPCLGDGPIRRTIQTLILNYDEELWKLFVLELDKYVHTESIKGVPYHRITSILEYSTTVIRDFTVMDYYHDGSYSSRYKEMMSEFLMHLIDKDILRFNYINGVYSIAQSFVEALLLISNCFIEWYNRSAYTEDYEALKSDGLLNEYLINATNIEKVYSYTSTFPIDIVGKRICTFKGRDVLVELEESKDEDSPVVAILLYPNTVSYMIYTILKVLNYNYGRENRNADEKIVNFL